MYIVIHTLNFLKIVLFRHKGKTLVKDPLNEQVKVLLSGSNIIAIRQKLEKADVAVGLAKDALERLKEIAKESSNPAEIRRIALKEGLT